MAVKTIGNPLSWGMRHVGEAAQGVAYAASHAGGEAGTEPVLRKVSWEDIRAALRLGLADFTAMRSDVIMACVLYPIVGACLIWFTLHQGFVPLAFPLLSGFALVGPVAAIGLYELSRRREAGEQPKWSDALSVVHAPGFGAVLLLGAGLAALFAFWLLAAWILHNQTMGAVMPDSVSGFLHDVLTTSGGRVMMLIGIPLGFVFALVALAVSAVSFPMMIDRDIGVPRAVVTSVKLFRQSPAVVLGWGAVIVAGLVIGALPFLIGLAVTLPILGHATWHFYRRAVAWS